MTPVDELLDVVVCDAGPARVMVAIAAARCGASVRLIVTHRQFDGVWTASLLSWVAPRRWRHRTIACRTSWATFAARAAAPR